jgi:hypothetical protein
LRPRNARVSTGSARCTTATGGHERVTDEQPARARLDRDIDVLPGPQHGLRFDLLEAEQREWLAAALGRPAEELHAKLSEREPRDAREAGFRDQLPSLVELVAAVRSDQ